MFTSKQKALHRKLTIRLKGKALKLAYTIWMPSLVEVDPHILSTPRQQHPAVPAPPPWEITRLKVKYEQYPYRWFEIELWDGIMQASCSIKDFDFTDMTPKIRAQLEKHQLIGISKVDMDRFVATIVRLAAELGEFYDINEQQLKKFEER